MAVTLTCGNASQWSGPKVDLVFTNPYAPLPKALHGLPSIISLFEGRDNRRGLGESWTGTRLTAVARWGKGGSNTIYVGNLPPRQIVCDDLIEDSFGPGKGWMPLALPLRLLDLWSDLIKPSAVVWDGFCGRGTIGRAALMHGYSYIGVDIDQQRVAMAKDYLFC